MDKFKLTIETQDRVINIPFKTISDLDEFTVLYDNYVALANRLNLIFNLNIQDIHRLNIYITYTYKLQDSDEYITKHLPIKYSYHNFDVTTLDKIYRDYYKSDYTRIKTTKDGICNVKYAPINEYVNGKRENITDKDIDIAVNAFFKNANYKKYRDAYFCLYEAGYDVKTKGIDETKIDRTDLNTYEPNNTFYENLVAYANKGYEEHAEVMDELSGYPTEELQRGFTNESYSLFDGLDNKNKELTPKEEELLALESLTGYEFDALSEYLNKNSQNKGYRR